MNYNINNEITIYPKRDGWIKIIFLLSMSYNISLSEAEELMNIRKTKDGGYRDVLWRIIDNLHELFYHGQMYLKQEISIP